MWRGLISVGEVVRVGEDFYTSKGNVERVTALVKELHEREGAITIKDFKNILGTGRRDAILYLEYLDMKGMTIRDGDVRRLRKT